MSNPPDPTTLLLTGVPGVGKSTVVRRVADGLTGETLGGFVTDEIRVHGRRMGFRLSPFGEPEAVLAHVNIRSLHKVGKYGVDTEALDRVVTSALAPGRDLYLVDEIGKMECFSRKFVSAITGLIASESPVVATVALRGKGFIAAVKSRPDVTLWEVTRANRDRMAGRVHLWLAPDGKRTP